MKLNETVDAFEQRVQNLESFGDAADQARRLGIKLTEVVNTLRTVYGIELDADAALNTLTEFAVAKESDKVNVNILERFLFLVENTDLDTGGIDTGHVEDLLIRFRAATKARPGRRPKGE